MTSFVTRKFVRGLVRCNPFGTLYREPCTLIVTYSRTFLGVMFANMLQVWTQLCARQFPTQRRASSYGGSKKKLFFGVRQWTTPSSSHTWANGSSRIDFDIPKVWWGDRRWGRSAPAPVAFFLNGKCFYAFTHCCFCRRVSTLRETEWGDVGLLGWSRDYSLNLTVFLSTVVWDALRGNNGKRPLRIDSPPVRAHSGIWRTSPEHVGSPQP
jgi:hypothetical protein